MSDSVKGFRGANRPRFGFCRTNGFDEARFRRCFHGTLPTQSVSKRNAKAHVAEAKSARYQWFLDYDPENKSIFVDAAGLRATFLTELVFACAFTLPGVERITGMPPAVAAAAIGAQFLSMPLVTILQPLARRYVVMFHVLSFFLVSCALAACLFFVVYPGDPSTLVWNVFVLYAAMNAALPNTAPSRVLLLLHSLAPLLALPFFWSHADRGSAIGSALFISAVSAATFHLIAMRSALHRQAALERDAALAKLREKDAELQRLRLARDLHDSVGSSLGLLAAQADLIKNAAHDPERIQLIAATMRGLARDGIGDLRGVLESLAPIDASVGALCDGLQAVVNRVTSTTAIDIALEGPADAMIDPPVRMALVRVFQEAIHNAVVHGHARKIHVRLSGGDALCLAIHDDGDGFDTSVATYGRGLPNMRARASELGIRMLLTSSPGGGTSVVLARDTQSA